MMPAAAAPPAGRDPIASESAFAWEPRGAAHRAVARQFGPELAQAILNSLPVGISLLGDRGERLFANEAAVALSSSRDAHGRSDGAAEPAAVDVITRQLTVGDSRFSFETYIDVTERNRIERELFGRAYFDELTGLANRTLLQQTAEALIRSTGNGDTFLLAFVDLDNFKHVNDCYSHKVGDQLLVAVARRLREMLGPDDVVARVGGDEFVLLLAPGADAATLVERVERVSDRLRVPLFVSGHEILASASIGVSLFPRHGRDYDVLYRCADSAMYRAKSRTKGQVAVYDASMEQAATARIETEQRLRLAIRDRRLTCAFQPKVDIRTDAVAGVEVLLRWRDSDGVIRAPGDFVGVAVELGLMDDITHFVVAETMAHLDRIDAAFGGHVTLSVNVAAKQAGDVPFMRRFAEAIAATGIADRFMIEITEEAFLAKRQFECEVLPLLRATGARVSIDDFGIGYSSLACLADITADEIKVDRAFITEIHKRPRSQMILKAIESLAVALGMSIVAEGVETEEELGYLLRETGIRYVQGYYFSRPISFERDRAREPASAADRDRPAGRAFAQPRGPSLRAAAPSRV